jgi:hypothetical protein
MFTSPALAGEVEARSDEGEGAETDMSQRNRQVICIAAVAQQASGISPQTGDRRLDLPHRRHRISHRTRSAAC